MGLGPTQGPGRWQKKWGGGGVKWGLFEKWGCMAWVAPLVPAALIEINTSFILRLIWQVLRAVITRNLLYRGCTSFMRKCEKKSH